MSALVIPTASDSGDYTLRVQLDEETFTLRFRWNTRMASWFMDLFDENEEPIVVGIRCVVEAPLTNRFRYIAKCPKGQFIIADAENRQLDPALADFGTRALLIYFEAAEGIGA